MTKAGRKLHRSAIALFTMAIAFLFQLNLAHAATLPTEIKLASEAWEDSTNEDGTGLYWDIMRLIYEPLGIKVEYSTTSYSRSVALVKQKKVDAWLGSYLDEEENIIYPKWHFDADIVAALYKKDPGFQWQGEESLAGKNVGWIKGYDYNEYIKTQFHNKEFKTRKQAVELLKKGRLDFFLEAQVEIEAELKKDYLDPAEFEYSTLMNLNLYPAFANNERGRQLQQVFDERFAKLLKSGELKKLFDKWEWNTFPFTI